MSSATQEPYTLLGKAAAAAPANLALIKYWGKKNTEKNLPASPSLAVTLSDLTTQTEVCLYRSNGKDTDSVSIQGKHQKLARFTPFFDEFRDFLRKKIAENQGTSLDPFSIRATSSSNFPLAAGLASSASGFAALSMACVKAAGINATQEELSSLARLGSASAARSLWGGFTCLQVGAERATVLYDAEWWPDLRIIVIEVEQKKKPISSRKAMEDTRQSSPYYNAWLQQAPTLFDQAQQALDERNLEKLGKLIRLSYLRMFATMFAANPPILYWKPGSIAILNLCEELRNEGIGVWETMDAGPQVKILCLEKDLPRFLSRFKKILPSLSARVCRVGSGPHIIGG